MCAQVHSAHIESIKWSHKETSREADILLYLLYTVSPVIISSYRCHRHKVYESFCIR